MELTTDTVEMEPSSGLVKIERAIISVSDKSNLETLANGLRDAGVEIYSTGGTRRYLRNVDLRFATSRAIPGSPR